jgi:hypothetical protein
MGNKIPPERFVNDSRLGAKTRIANCQGRGSRHEGCVDEFSRVKPRTGRWTARSRQANPASCPPPDDDLFGIAPPERFDAAVARLDLLAPA